MDRLITRRPGAYTQLGFQRFLLWFFIMLGIMLFFNTVYIVVNGIVHYLFIDEASYEIANRYQLNQLEVKEILVRYFDPLKFKAMFYSFFLSLALFFMARYAQKVINRNRYIISLEQAWMNRRTI